jgi:hypothetical protein
MKHLYNVECFIVQQRVSSEGDGGLGAIADDPGEIVLDECFEEERTESEADSSRERVGHLGRGQCSGGEGVRSTPHLLRPNEARDIVTASKAKRKRGRECVFVSLCVHASR